MKLLVLATALLASTPLAVSAASWSPAVTTQAVWHSNASNADRSADILSALQFKADAVSQQTFGLGRSDSLTVGAHLNAEALLRFDGLDRAAFGPSVTWSHKFGLGAFAPVFSVELSASGIAARESRRSGLSGSLTASARKRLDSATRLGAAYELSRHDARAELFDRTGRELSAFLSRDLAAEWNLTATLRYRHGDILSYSTPPRADLVALAKIREPNTTFDRTFIAYSLDARSLGGGLALSRPLDSTTTLTFGYDFRRTTRRPVHYINHLVSAAVTRQF